MPLPVRSGSPTKLPQRFGIEVLKNRDSAPLAVPDGRSTTSVDQCIRSSVSTTRDGESRLQSRNADHAPPSAFRVPRGEPSVSEASKERPRSSSRPSVTRSSSGTPIEPRLRSTSQGASNRSTAGSRTSRDELQGETSHQSAQRLLSRGHGQPTSAANGMSNAPSQLQRRASSSHGNGVKPSSRLSFSTYQQQFTPQSQKHRRTFSQANPTVPIALPYTTNRRASTVPSRTNHNSPDPPSRETVRQQAHLLHLSILYEAAAPTYAQWLTSAHSKLSSRHIDCQALYAQHLKSARSVRQAQNLLALHRWGNGNIASLSRKLGVLADVLKEVSELLTAHKEPYARDESNAADPEQAIHEPPLGAFILLTQQFETWMTFVQEEWASRDQRSSSAFDDPPSASAYWKADFQQQDGEDAHSIQPIPGLGDGVKSSIRTLTATLNRLATRLTDLQNPPIPSDPLPLSQESHKTADLERSSAQGLRDGSFSPPLVPTPRRLVDLAWSLVQGMREEVQTMREAEFEVVVGEKAWMEQVVQQIGGQVEGGFESTPLRRDLLMK